MGFLVLSTVYAGRLLEMIVWLQYKISLSRDVATEAEFEFCGADFEVFRGSYVDNFRTHHAWQFLVQGNFKNYY